MLVGVPSKRRVEEFETFLVGKEWLERGGLGFWGEGRRYEDLR
jgi:hypothetical protein